MDSTAPGPIWKRVWALPIPQRVKTFLQVTLHNQNLNNVERFQHHLASSTLCDICRFNMEDMNHILQHCVAARGLWVRVIHPDLLSDFMQAPLDDWMQHNIVISTTGSIHGV
ncbi:hypothetical protein V6N13_123605 [Hibiscus sabdariffa]